MPSCYAGIQTDQYLTQQEKKKAGQLYSSFPIFFQLLINYHILYSESNSTIKFYLVWLVYVNVSTNGN